MKVSLIVPCYKAGDWYDECKASIRAQTYEDIDVTYIYDLKGIGAAAARNQGLEKTTGDFVAFCDADDILAPDAIEKMVAAMEGVDMVCGSFRKFGLFDAVVQHDTETLTMKQVAEYAMGNLHNPRSNQLLSGCWAKLYRRSLVKPFPPLTTAEDMAFNYDYLMRCERVRFISDIVYHNRKRDGSLSTTFDEKNKDGLFGFMKALEYVERFLESQGCDASPIDTSKVYHAQLYFMRVCQHTGLPMNEAFKRLYP